MIVNSHASQKQSRCHIHKIFFVVHKIISRLNSQLYCIRLNERSLISRDVNHLFIAINNPDNIFFFKKHFVVSADTRVA